VFSFSGYQVFPIVMVGSPLACCFSVCLSLGDLFLRNRFIILFLFVVVSTTFCFRAFCLFASCFKLYLLARYLFLILSYLVVLVLLIVVRFIY
jgi:hypothetical protein